MGELRPMQAGDYSVASSWCEQLVAGGHEEGWVVCQQLGQCAQFGNLSVRSRLLDFAITNAHPRSLQELIQARNEVEVGLLCAKVNACIDLDASTPDSDDGFVDAPTHQEDPDARRTEDELETENDGQTNDEHPLTEEQDGYKGDDEESDDVSEITDRVGEEGSGGRGLLLGTLGVTKSVLSATASTTKNLMSNMSNKQFWRKAISWMEPLHEMSLRDSSIMEVDTNANVSQQGCHAFYLDLVPHHHISNIGASYRSYAPPSINSPALDFSLTLLRIALLEETISEGGVSKVNMEVIQEVVRSVLREDVPLGLMFLAVVKLPEKAYAIFSGFPRTDISLQMTQYYYALQIYTAIYPWQKPNIASVFLHNPSELIDVVSDIVASIDTSFEKEIIEYVEYFKATKELIADYVQGQALLRLGAGVDIDRFLVDGNYKEDTVLGLSMTLDTEVLELAVTLAKKYDVSLWQVYMTHTQFLFDSDISTEELEKRCRDLKLLEELSKCPKEFVYSMEKNVLLTVNGCDHPRLLFYYAMLEEGGRKGESKQTQESVSRASAHIKFLKKLKGTASDLNYKLLLQPGTNILSLLRPVLTADNVNVFAKVAKSIPNSDGHGIEPSTVYCAWAQKCFFDYTKEKKPKTGSDWIHRYEKIGEYIQKMNEKDFEDFISGILFSEGSENVSLDARREIIRRAIKFMRQQTGKTKIPEESEPWKLGSERLEQWGNHLDVLRSDTFQQLQGSINPVLRKYAKQFELTQGDSTSLQQLTCKVLLDGCNLASLQTVLSVFPEEAMATPEDVMMDVVRFLVSIWQGKPTIEVDIVGLDLLEALSHVLVELKGYLQDGGDMLSEEEVMDELRPICENKNLSISTRVEILKVIEKHLTLSNEDQQLISVMRTGSIVALAWKDVDVSAIDPEELATADGRSNLLESLIVQTSEEKQGHALVTLLQLWPSFEDKVYSITSSNPWIKVCDKLLQLVLSKHINKQEILELVWCVSKENSHSGMLGRECIFWLLEHLQGCGIKVIKYSTKVALLSDDLVLHEKVIEDLKKLEKLEEGDCDEEMLRAFVTRNLVTKVLSTVFYGPLVSHLNESNDKSLLHSAVSQLQNAGYEKEAASLVFSSSSLPKSLCTVSSALATYNKLI